MLLKALEDLSNVTQFLEQKFADELHIFFQYLGRKIIENVDLEDPLTAVFYQQANGVIQEHWKEYDDILSTYFNAAGLVGYVYHKILLKASQDRAKELSLKSKDPPIDVSLEWYMREQLTHYNPEVAQDLETYRFVASEKTMNRVTTEINNILSDGYRTEKGHYEIRDRIKERFTQLSTYESMRIAQTEVNSMRNYSQFSSMLDDEMEYKIWMEANDSRTRPSHKNEKGGVGHEIVPINEKFSNGLRFAGDKNGKISEWVNCRCSIAAYIIPMGYQAPAFFPFRENDLVKVGDTDPMSYLPDAPTIDVGGFTPEVREQLNTFANESRSYDKEKGILISQDGKRVYTTPFGSTHSCDFDAKAVADAYNENGELHLDHNHPTSDKKSDVYTCLSNADCSWIHYGETVETWAGDHWEYNRVFYIKSVTAECGNGSRMSLVRNDGFTYDDITQFNKAVELLDQVYDKWSEEPQDYVDRKCEEILEQTGMYPSIDESNRIKAEAESYRQQVLASFEERMIPVQKEFEKANCQLIIEWL